VDTLSSTSALIQTLTSYCKEARILTSEKVSAKRLTSATARITALRRVHEQIEQSAGRDVWCTNTLSSCGCDNNSGNDSYSADRLRENSKVESSSGLNNDSFSGDRVRSGSSTGQNA